MVVVLLMFFLSCFFSRVALVQMVSVTSCYRGRERECNQRRRVASESLLRGGVSCQTFILTDSHRLLWVCLSPSLFFHPLFSCSTTRTYTSLEFDRFLLEFYVLSSLLRDPGILFFSRSFSVSLFAADSLHHFLSCHVFMLFSHPSKPRRESSSSLSWYVCCTCR